jgi:putative Ca2+/H+ antiporter (TMEM165/GDT1 family)
MQWRVMLSTFGLIFLAEMGDKTQLMAISLAGKTKAPWSVLAGAAVALCAVSAIGVFAGAALTRFVPAGYVQKAAAVLFIGIGVLMLFSKD